ETVSVSAKAGSTSHPYLKKIFAVTASEREKGATVSETDLDRNSHTWKIDKESRSIHVRHPSVVTLLRSPELHKIAKGDEAVAITWGVDPTASGGGAKKAAPAVASGGELSQDRKVMKGGRVLYVLSHFGKQGSTTEEHSLQNLLINCL